MRGWLNLVDFYKVSLAARDGLGLMLARVRCHTDSTDITDFLHRCARRRAGAVFLIRLALRAEISLIL